MHQPPAVPPVYVAVFGLCLLLTTPGCPGRATLEQIEAGVPQAAAAEPITEESLFSLRDDGRFLAELRVECAEGGGEPIRLDRFQRLPEFVTDATVVLSGWSVRFLEGDRHVVRLAASIRDIDFDDGILTWRAEGHLADRGFDDRYRWCYHYTVLAWSSQAVDAVVDDTDAGHSNGASSRAFTTSLITLPSYVQNQGFAGRTSVPLPRGFAFLVLDDFDDIQLLQAAYDLSQVEDLAPPGTYGQLPSPSLPGGRPGLRQGLASWLSRAVFSDNRVKTPYRFDELVSGFAGESVGWIEPPHSPEVFAERTNPCIGNPPPAGVRTEEYFVEGLPFDYAVPVLTGWDLRHDCRGDRDLLEAGVWLNHFNYHKEEDDPTGTLEVQVSSVFQDDGEASHDASHRFSILGLDRRQGPILPEGPNVPPVIDE